MRQGLLGIATHHGLAGLGAAVVRLAALAESAHRADAARAAANDLSLYREDPHEAHGSASRPVTLPPTTEPAGLHHREVLQ